MMNLLNAASFFGFNFDWNYQKTIIVLIAIQAALVVVALSLIIYLIMRRRLKRQLAKNTVLTVAQPTTQPEVVYIPEPKVEVARELTGVSLDLGVVQREFVTGDTFNCDGLIVKTEYNVSPKSESLADYTIVDIDTYNSLKDKNRLYGVYVIRPNMLLAGKKVVTVKLDGQSATYTISVNEPKAVEEKQEPVQVEPTPVVVEKIVEVEKPVVVEKVVEKPVVVEKVVEKPVVMETVVYEEESVEAGRLRYDKSFEARLIQSDDELKHWYTEIKNELLSYKTCKGRISWKRETFKANKRVVAMLVYRGKRLCLLLPLDATDYDESYHLEDASDVPAYAEIPAMIRLKNEKRVRIAKQLIADAMNKMQVIPNPYYKSEDFYVPYEGILELINKGLIRREIRTAEQEEIFERDKEN